MFETFGPVSHPMYVVLFEKASEIDPERVKTGVKIYSVRQYANYVFTKPLRGQKGSDASNQYDEEPNESVSFRKRELTWTEFIINAVLWFIRN